MIFDHVPAQEPSILPAKIAFVGEAPSTEERLDGVPLVGPSGRIFNALLRTAGLERSEFAVTNVFDEQLPNNKVENWCISLQEARQGGFTDLPPIGAAGFLAPQHRWHLDRLREELERWKPTVIVPLGGTALWAFVGQTSITALRGTPIAATRLVPGTKLVPTFHPAFVMRQYKLYTTVARDFQKAYEEAVYGPDIRIAKRTLLLEPTVEDIRDYLPKLLNSPLLSVDIETYGKQISCIGFAPDHSSAICIPFMDKRSPDHSYWPNPQVELAVWKMVREVLASDVPKVGQNYGAYDAYRLLVQYHIPTRNFLHDTRLLSHAIYPELPKSLLFLGSNYATQGAWKHWGRHGKGQAKKDDTK